MFYTIYKITNKINGKIYIGKHQTKDLNDGYMGSGKRLRHALNKYGIENFEKEILFQFVTEEEMNSKEAELVTEEFCLREDTYNMCPGGKGGWGYLNSSEGLKTENRINSMKRWNSAGVKAYKKKIDSDENLKKEIKEHLFSIGEKGRKTQRSKYPNGTFFGKKHTEETLDKLRKPKNIKENNPNYGKIWIYSNIEKRCIMITSDQEIPEGWTIGRKMKF